MFLIKTDTKNFIKILYGEYINTIYEKKVY